MTVRNFPGTRRGGPASPAPDSALDWLSGAVFLTELICSKPQPDPLLVVQPST